MPVVRETGASFDGGQCAADYTLLVVVTTLPLQFGLRGQRKAALQARSEGDVDVFPPSP